jgi:hypothetical protein
MVSQTDDERVSGLNVILLSLGLSCALFVGGLIYVLKNGELRPPVNDSTYIALRSAYRVIDFLHLQAASPVNAIVARRQPASGMERLGIEICTLVTVLGLTAAAWLLLSLLSNLRHFRNFVKRSTLIFLLFAAPVSYLTVVRLTWYWTRYPGDVPQHGSFWESLPLMVFIGEIAFLCATLTLRYVRRRMLSNWEVAIFVLVHLSFWMYFLWGATSIHMYSQDIVLLLVAALPFVCVLQDVSRPLPVRGHLKSPWMIGIATALLIPLFAVWAPTNAVAVSHPQDLAALKIELVRGPCFGSCPQYTITVQGDGRVEYLGRQGHSRLESRKLGKIERAKIVQILQTLDKVRFMTLDDRAFSWAFDTPSVGIRITEDGRTKQVGSDAEFVGSKNGRQSRFVDAADAIDSTLRSTQWDFCEGEECASPASTGLTPD